MIMKTVGCLLLAFAIVGCGQSTDRITGTQAKAVLRRDGIITSDTEVVSCTWLAEDKSWLIITDHGKREGGSPLRGHWFVSADGSDWSGSTCRY